MPLGVHAAVGAVRIELQDRGAIHFRGSRVRIVDVRPRADSDQHFLAVAREHDIASRMPASGEHARRHDDLLWAAGLQVASLVRESNDRIGVTDVDVRGLCAWRIKRDAERPIQPAREHFDFLRLAGGVEPSQHSDPVLSGFGDEEIAVWRRANNPRILEVFLVVQRDRIARERLRHRAFGSRHHFRVVLRRLRRKRRGQIRHRDLVHHARPLVAVIRERRLGAILGTRLAVEGRQARGEQTTDAADTNQTRSKRSHHHGLIITFLTARGAWKTSLSSRGPQVLNAHWTADNGPRIADNG
jgi:hypothetical protein